MKLVRCDFCGKQFPTFVFKQDYLGEQFRFCKEHEIKLFLEKKFKEWQADQNREATIQKRLYGH